MTYKPSRPNRRRPRRGPVAAVLSAAALLSLPLIADAAHWPQFGGDAGHSGNQPVQAADMPTDFLYTMADGGSLRTSLVTTGGATPADQAIAYGKQITVANTSNDIGRIHIRNLLDGAELVTDANGDVDDTDDDPDVFGPGAGGVTPVEAGGQLYVVHNDTDSDAAATNGCNPLSVSDLSDNDIALAQYNTDTGAKVRDFAIGQAQGSPPDPTCPSRTQATDGFTIESSPVITPVLADGTRRLFFVAKDDDAPGGRLFSVAIGADGTPSLTGPAFRDFPTLNTKVSPAIAYLTDPSRATVVPYVLFALNAPEDASDIIALKALDISSGQNAASPKGPIGVPGNPAAISVPVTQAGTLPGQDGGGNQAPAIFVSYSNGEQAPNETTTVRRFLQSSTDLTLLRQTTPSQNTTTKLPGIPSTGIATDAIASADGTLDEGRIAVTTGKNLYLLGSDSLSELARFSPTPLLPNSTGFSRTVPLVSGGFTFVTRDDGAQLVLEEVEDTLVRVPASDFQENDLNNNSLFGLGQPSLSRGFLQFISDRGLFVYKTGIAVTPPPANDAPVADFTATPNPARAGETVTFNGSGSTDKEGPIAAYQWDFNGDGTFDTAAGQSATTTNAYGAPGTYKVTLRVTDGGGKTDDVTKDVVIQGAGPGGTNAPPTANFSAAPNPAKVGESVAFDASASSDAEGPIASYQWDFDGNGTFETNTGTNPKANRTYATAGVFNVKLRVTDGSGAAADVVKQVTVVGAATTRCNPVRCRPSLTSRVRPGRDRRAPFRFRTTGRLGLPSGVAASEGCRGRVAIQVKRGRKTLSNRRAQVRSNCTFSKRVSFSDRSRFRRARSLRFAVRFQGNKFLTPRSATTKRARVR